METIYELIRRYPALSACHAEIERAADMIIGCYKNCHTIYACGNGGSAADADHIVGELMKGFLKKRQLNVDEQLCGRIKQLYPDNADFLISNLQFGLPAISLHSQSALLTAFANDVDASMMYAQTLFALGKAGDILLAISTSGNSKNVVNAAKIAKIIGVNVVSLTGEQSCALDNISDCTIHVAAAETYRVQELHLPAYHWICARVEAEFFDR